MGRLAIKLGLPIAVFGCGAFELRFSNQGGGAGSKTCQTSGQEDAAADGACGRGGEGEGGADDSCKEIESEKEALWRQFVDTKTISDCNADEDCVWIDLGGQCGTLVNKETEAAFERYRGNDLFQELERAREARCPVTVNTCNRVPSACRENKCTVFKREEPTSTPTPTPRQTSTADSCEGLEQAKRDLIAQFVDLEAQLTCTSDNECIRATTGEMCGGIVNKTAADGYGKYLASDAYENILGRFEGLQCPTFVGLCAAPGTPVCQDHRCTESWSPTPTPTATPSMQQFVARCGELSQAMEDLIPRFVDRDSQFACTADSECDLAPSGVVSRGYIGNFCSTSVNKAAAEGYGSYFSSNDYTELRERFRELGCEILLPSTPCVVEPGVPRCINSACTFELQTGVP